jgi:hypothetical protein
VVFLSRDPQAPGVISFESFDNANDIFDEREDGVTANPNRARRLPVFHNRAAADEIQLCVRQFAHVTHEFTPSSNPTLAKFAR